MVSLFDYDTRPATPGVVLITTGTSAEAYRIRDFLSRNGRPYEWVDLTDVERVRSVLGEVEIDVTSLPICVLPDGTQLSHATLEQVAAGLSIGHRTNTVRVRLDHRGCGSCGPCCSRLRRF